MVLLKSAGNYVIYSKKNKSTFHYGSIKIEQVEDALFKCCTSTFHYGSIKMAGMFIIKRAVALSTFHYGSIKISVGVGYGEKSDRSTFHYGSIKIRAYKTLYIMLFIASYFVDLK